MPGPPGLTPRVVRWRRMGAYVELAGRRLFVRDRPGVSPPLLLLHGFPSSSYDWRHAFELLPARRITTFDFLGFGLSAKPRHETYSLRLQADLVQEVVGRYVARPVVIVAHDMGTSVLTELLARDLEGRLPFEIEAVLLFNGSMVLEQASLTVGQRLLRSPLGPVAARLSNEPSFRRQFAALFTARHPLSEDEAADQWSLLAHDHGQRILDRLIFYLHERVRYAERWHGALRDWPGRLELAWAGQDPVCTEAVLQAVRDLRPHAPLTRLPDLGHYPQLEDPGAVMEIIERVAAGAAGAVSS
jgi:pimeloyl-ACP methyl ester carboxylesterase